MSYVEFRAAVVVILAGGVPEDDVVVKLDDAGFIRDVGVLVTWCSVAGPSGH